MDEKNEKKSGKTRKIVWISLSSLFGIFLIAGLFFAGVVAGVLLAREGGIDKFGRWGKSKSAEYSFFFDEQTVANFDADEDGSLTRKEFVNSMLGIHTENVNIMFNRFDRDEDGVLSAEELKDWVSRGERERRGRKGRKKRYHDDDDHYDDDHHDDDYYDDDDDYDDDDRRRRRRS